MAASSPSPPADPSPDRPQGIVGKVDTAPAGKVEQLKVIGGLLALVAGLITLLVVLAFANRKGVSSNQFRQLATTVIGVVGSIVGAYFGLKIGTDGTDKALEAQRQEAARAQIFAAHLPPKEALEALQLAFPGAGQAPPQPNPPPPAGQPAPPANPRPAA